MVVFPDTMYTFRNTQGRGVKIDNFFHSLFHSKILHALIQRGGGGGGGGKGPGPPEKNKLYTGFNRE